MKGLVGVGKFSKAGSFDSPEELMVKRVGTQKELN
jgi:hypothetical protein